MAGVYWQGANGNYYVKAAGMNGVQDMGSSLSPLSPQFISGLKQISDPNAPASGSTTSGGTGASTPAGLSAFLGASNLQLGNLQHDLATTNQEQAAALAGGQASYNDQMNALGNQFNQGKAANQKAQVDLNNAGNLSLSNLGDQLRGQYNNYMGQLGAAGAGSSSAADLVHYALGQQGAQGQSNLNTQQASQQTGLNQNIANLQANYQQQAQALKDWKTQTLQGIVDQYTAVKQNIQNQILSVGSDQARTALYMQDAAAANQALSSMRDAVSQFNTASSNLHSQYTDAVKTMPQAALNTQGYQVQQFNAPQVAGLSYQSNAAPVAVNNAPGVAGLKNTGTNLPGTLASVS